MAADARCARVDAHETIAAKSLGHDRATLAFERLGRAPDRG